MWLQHKNISPQISSPTMAYKCNSTFLALLLISYILLATVAAGRHITKNSKPQDKKEPEFLFHSGGDAYIPGIGRVGLPPQFKLPHYPYTGGSTGGGIEAGSGPTGRSYVPGGDDIFVPNPGYEVPYPGTSGGGAPTPVLP
ncbi:putative cell wall protein [Prosopis cineraria]|uniref:putative cell wall protein n=1 Tax=Prosopis cineraria TaxID=364024 RepID=UPI00240EB833|nr:putative cell wall protein [Prosopis cineraria]